MKKIVLVFSFLCCFIFAKAQYTIDSKPFSDIESYYIKAFITSSFTFDGCSLRIEHGPRPSNGLKLKSFLTDSRTGQKVYFQSSVQALNYLRENGYKIAHVVSDDKGEICTYIMERF